MMHNVFVVIRAFRRAQTNFIGNHNMIVTDLHEIMVVLNTLKNCVQAHSN